MENTEDIELSTEVVESINSITIDEVEFIQRRIDSILESYDDDVLKDRDLFFGELKRGGVHAYSEDN
jgi:hypothetical protein